MRNITAEVGAEYHPREWGFAFMVNRFVDSWMIHAMVGPFSVWMEL